MSAGYSPSHGLGGLAGSNRFSPPVSCPYGIPLKVKTPPSRNPRTLPYCVLAIAERGVLQFPGSWCVSVLVLSDALAVRASAADRPAVAGRSNAWRRLSFVLFSEFDLDICASFQGTSDASSGQPSTSVSRRNAVRRCRDRKSTRL